MNGFGVKHRLMPFTHVEEKEGELILRTPDMRADGLPASCAPEIDRLAKGWCEPSALSISLLAVGVATDGSVPEYNQLLDVADYFRDAGREVRAIRRGSKQVDAAPSVPGYRVLLPDGTMGLGSDESLPLALLKAVAEVYERDACSVVHNQELLRDQPRETVLRPVVYADWQLRRPGFPYVADPVGKYVDATDPVMGSCASVPAELVFYPYTELVRCGEATSNGVAAYTDHETALFRGACELIERDVLMLHWFREMPREQIGPPEAFRVRVARLKALQYEVTFINLTLELMPVILAIARRPAGLHPRLILGMGCSPLPEVAFDKALEELESSATATGLPPGETMKPEEVVNVADHQRWYCQGNNSDLVMELVGCGHIDLGSISEGPDTVVELYAELHRHGMTWHAIDLNQVGAKRTGLHVVRSVIPQLIPIDFGYTMEPLGHPRLHRTNGMSNTGDTPRRTTILGYEVQPLA